MLEQDLTLADLDELERRYDDDQSTTRLPSVTPTERTTQPKRSEE